MIDRSHPTLSLSAQCELVAISRASIYYRPKGESPETLALMRTIDALFMKYPFYGSRQIVRHLAREGVSVGRHRVRRLMRLMGLAAIYQAPRTSQPHPEHKIYPYLLKGLSITRPNQVWCADITYIPMRRGFLYLVAIMDWATRKVLSWKLSNTMDAGFCVEALERQRMATHTAGRRSSTPTRAVSSPAPTSPHGPQGRRGHGLHGWAGPLHGQHLHRTAVALAQVRGDPPARD